MQAAQNGYRHSARFIRPFVRAVRRHHARPPARLNALESFDQSAWVSYAESAEFCRWAMAATGDANLGLHAAEAMEPGEFDVVEYAARSSANIEGAIDAVNRYIGLLREGARFSLKTEGGLCTWHLDMAVELPRCINDWTVAAYVLQARRLTAGDWCPLEVHVSHGRPADTREYGRILGAPVSFGARSNAIVFPQEWLATPLRGADARLHEVMLRCASGLLEGRPSTETFVERVRAAVVESMGQGHPCPLRVARRLHVSERTLRRRLQEQGTNYKQLLDDVRFELASGYLRKRRDMGVAELAFMLGYSHTPAFSRAFKRWTGVTPASYRDAVQSQPEG